MMKSVVLFLDFDGVFHPLMSNGLKFIDLPNFENFIRKHSDRFDFKLVISSNWRREYTLSQISKFFSPDIALKLVGVTPVLNTIGDGVRLEEAQQWRAQNDMNSAWFALDDDHYAWDRVEQLVWCHDKFQEREIGILEDKLSQLF